MNGRDECTGSDSQRSRTVTRKRRVGSALAMVNGIVLAIQTVYVATVSVQVTVVAAVVVAVVAIAALVIVR